MEAMELTSQTSAELSPCFDSFSRIICPQLPQERQQEPRTTAASSSLPRPDALVHSWIVEHVAIAIVQRPVLRDPRPPRRRPKRSNAGWSLSGGGCGTVVVHVEEALLLVV